MNSIPQAVFSHAGTYRLDPWGRRVVQAWDGHGAWNCNNFECAQHPQGLYTEV